MLRAGAAGQKLMGKPSIPELVAQVLAPPQATLLGGWDVVAAEEGGLTDAAWRDALGGDGLTDVGRPLTLRRGQPLHRADRTCRQFYVLIEVHCS